MVRNILFQRYSSAQVGDFVSPVAEKKMRISPNENCYVDMLNQSIWSEENAGLNAG